MKILWHSNAPWAPTGYGNQTAEFAPKVAAMEGVEVAISAYYGLQGHVLNWNGIEVYPGGKQLYGQDVIEKYVAMVGADVLVTLCDVWVLDRETMGRLPWAAWVPVDHEPMPPMVRAMLEVCRWPVAMSKFGLEQMKQQGIKGAHYVPHGVNTCVFKPIDRGEARERIAEVVDDQHETKGLLNEDTYLVAMVAANKGFPSRKSFPEVMTAWKIFTEQRENVHLYLHTDKAGRQGVDFAGVMGLLGIDPDTVSFAPQAMYSIGGIGPEYMNKVYNAADVLLNPAHGEGFGIPIIEAQAAGCPVIVGDNTAMTELCMAGWSVKGAPIMTPMMAFQFRPIESEIVRTLEEAYQARGDVGLRERARAGAMQYDADVVMAVYWKPFFERVQAEIEAGQKVAEQVVGRMPGGDGKSLKQKRADRRRRNRARGKDGRDAGQKVPGTGEEALQPMRRSKAGKRVLLPA